MFNEVINGYTLNFTVDCERLGEAIDKPKRLHRSDGGGCKCCHFYVWVILSRGKYKFPMISSN